MSNRNPKRPAPKATKPTRKRQQSISSTSTFDYPSQNSFSDDHYSGVDDIDDEDEDEEDVAAVEEQDILDEPSPVSTPRPDHDNDEEEDDANDGDDESGTNDDNATEASWPGLSDEEWEMKANDEYLDEYMGRKVRFAVPSDSSSSVSDDNEHLLMYPDILVPQSMLDPAFRREIEQQDDTSSLSETFYDHENYNAMDDLVLAPPPMHSDNAMAPPSNQSMDLFDMIPDNLEDEYDSDGETTEDEEYPEGPIKPPATEPLDEDSPSDSDYHKPVRHSKDEPLTTAFSLNKRRNKPIAVYNTKTKKMMFFTPSGNLAGSDEQLFSEARFAMNYSEPSSPLKHGDIDFQNPSYLPGYVPHHASAQLPADALNQFDLGVFPDPFLDLTQTLDVSSESSDAEDDIDVNAFLDMGETSDDSRHEPASTPLRPTTASSDANVLGHLHSSNVGAFRQNQVNTRHLQNGGTQDSIDFAAPYLGATIKGIRSDRFDTAIAPLTPVRRHKRHNSDAARSPLDAASTKRKASGEASSAQGNHKKQKSISTELTDLHM